MKWGDEEDDLEHHRKTLDEEVEWPFCESSILSLTVSATLNHRPTQMMQVLIEPLFAQHRDECGQQRDQETCVHQAGDGDNLAGKILLDRRNGGGFVWDCGLVEGEEDGAEEGCRLVIGEVSIGHQ